MPRQRPIHGRRIALTRAAAIQALHHCDYGVVAQMISCGYLVAFDVGTGNRKKCLRVFDLPIRRNGRRLSRAATVLAKLLPVETEIPAVEFGKLIGCTRPHVLKLVRQGLISGRLNGHQRLVNVGSVRHFLASRHVKPENARGLDMSGRRRDPHQGSGKGRSPGVRQRQQTAAVLPQSQKSDPNPGGVQ